MPTIKQPGNLFVPTVSTWEKEAKNVKSLVMELIKARQTSKNHEKHTRDYHIVTAEKNTDATKVILLNFLFDCEVARRLQVPPTSAATDGSFDSIPVASAIIAMLEKESFQASFLKSFEVFTSREPNERIGIAKRLIEPPPTTEQQYLDYFGGASESEIDSDVEPTSATSKRSHKNGLDDTYSKPQPKPSYY